MALLIASLMFAAAAAAVVVRPSVRLMAPEVPLSRMLPLQFGDWREDGRQLVEVVNPQLQAAVKLAYDQTLERAFLNSDGYRIMLSVAYSADHRGSVQMHQPEVCYPAQGFVVHSREVLRLETPFGEIPVRRLLTSKGPRMEPVTYWIKVGDKAVMPSGSKLVELGYVLTGRIPDGLLFRVSSIDREPIRAYRMQADFINQLLRAVSPADRRRLSGLGDPRLQADVRFDAEKSNWRIDTR